MSGIGKPAQHQARVGRQTSCEMPEVKDFEAVESLKSAHFPQRAGFRATHSRNDA
jgi:hypothetical protein